jgi:tetratricopeptide (TPR) repeat protein
MRMPVLAVTVLLAASWSAFGAGSGGSTPVDRSSGIASRLREAPTPAEEARTNYNIGVRGVEKGDELAADAARQSDAAKRDKLDRKAQGAYSGALKKFVKATELNPRMHEAWNYIGFINRKLGKYTEALAAYDRALAIDPNYAEAIEYRGHAYLGLNRLGEAKEAYLTLFSANRQLAAKLLTAMQEYVGAQRGAAGVDGAALDAFASWVSERSAIAAQTAGLTRAGAESSWR